MRLGSRLLVLLSLILALAGQAFAIRMSSAGNLRTATLTYSDQRHIFVPFLFNYKSFAHVDYDRSGDWVFIRSIDMSVYIWNSEIPNLPINPEAAVSVEIISNGRVLGTYRPTRGGDYLVGRPDSVFGGVAFPNIWVSNPTYKISCTVYAQGSLGWSTDSREFPKTYTFYLRANRGGAVYAQNGGGGFIGCNSNYLSDWERFSIIDRDGKELRSGDKVNLRTSLTRQFLYADGGGGGGVFASGPWDSVWETPEIRLAGGKIGDRIYPWSQVGFFMPNTGKYWTAHYDYPNAQLRASAPWFSDWEKFTLIPQG